MFYDVVNGYLLQRALTLFFFMILCTAVTSMFWILSLCVLQVTPYDVTSVYRLILNINFGYVYSSENVWTSSWSFGSLRLTQLSFLCPVQNNIYYHKWSLIRLTSVVFFEPESVCVHFLKCTFDSHWCFWGKKLLISSTCVTLRITIQLIIFSCPVNSPRRSWLCTWHNTSYFTFSRNPRALKLSSTSLYIFKRVPAKFYNVFRPPD